MNNIMHDVVVLGELLVDFTQSETSERAMFFMRRIPGSSLQFAGDTKRTG